jgi:formylglycine-generating enzyme required for sulfatase activity
MRVALRVVLILLMVAILLLPRCERRPPGPVLELEEKAQRAIEEYNGMFPSVAQFKLDGQEWRDCGYYGKWYKRVCIIQPETLEVSYRKSDPLVATVEFEAHEGCSDVGDLCETADAAMQTEVVAQLWYEYKLRYEYLDGEWHLASLVGGGGTHSESRSVGNGRADRLPRFTLEPPSSIDRPEFNDRAVANRSSEGSLFCARDYTYREGNRLPRLPVDASGLALLGPFNRFGNTQEVARDTEKPARPVGEVPPPKPDVTPAEDKASCQTADVTTNSIGMELVLVSAGEFMMGSPESEADRSKNENQHLVRITRPFYMGVYEVTQAEYERVMGKNPSSFSRNGLSSEKVAGRDTSRFPVERVSWEDAKEFCRRLSLLPGERAAGRAYRLPTEAEWEYACRAGTTTPFHFGRVANGFQGNFNGISPYGTKHRGRNLNRTTEVGSYPPNAWGLYDMHGNVHEWCEDWYDRHYRVVRGGCWFYGARLCRAACRACGRPDGEGSLTIGFRIVFSADESTE